jgi:AcrR family transcriptional regulator
MSGSARGPGRNSLGLLSRGVGPGTLYRHFPTREELLQAVYRSELEKLAAAERKFAQIMPPIEALRTWLLLFVDAIETKQIIAPALQTLIGDPKKVFAASTPRSIKRFMHWWNGPSRAAIYVRTSNRST